MNPFLQWLKRLYRRLPTPPSTNYVYREIRPNPYHLLPPNPTVFDIGSKDAGARYSFGNPPAGAKVVCVDIEAGENVDLVADAHDLHMDESNSVDCVIAISALEHMHD